MNNDIPFNKLYRTVSANHFLLFFKVTFGIVLKSALGSVLSDSISFKRGGLQRSTLTPLFFNLCFNGLATLVETSKIYQFADDYLMVSGNWGYSLILPNIKDDDRNVTDWFKGKLKTINYVKIRLLCFRNKQKTVPNDCFITIRTSNCACCSCTRIFCVALLNT